MNKPQDGLVEVTQADENLTEQIVVEFSDKAILGLDIGEDDVRLERICDEMRNVVRHSLARHRVDAILTLLKENERLRTALREIVDHDERRKVPGSQGYMIDVTSSDLQVIARRALAASEDGHG